MRKSLSVILMAVMALSAVSCDFMRSFVGRPTSADIDAKRIVIQKAQMAEKARLDSIEAVRRHIADSVSLTDSIMTSVSITPMHFTSSQLPCKYCVMVGMFSNSRNASIMAGKMTSAGFNPLLIPFKSGSVAVASCPSDDIQEVFRVMNELKGQAFCPKDICIMSKKQ